MKAAGSVWRKTHYHRKIKCDCGFVFEQCSAWYSVECPYCKATCPHENKEYENGYTCNHTWCRDCGHLLAKDDYSAWPGEHIMPCSEEQMLEFDPERKGIPMQLSKALAIIEEPGTRVFFRVQVAPDAYRYVPTTADEAGKLLAVLFSGGEVTNFSTVISRIAEGVAVGYVNS